MLLAPVCSSYSAVNLATSKRSILCPWGDVTVTSVRRGNKLLSRLGGFFCGGLVEGFLLCKIRVVPSPKSLVTSLPGGAAFSWP